MVSSAVRGVRLDRRSSFSRYCRGGDSVEDRGSRLRGVTTARAWERLGEEEGDLVMVFGVRCRSCSHERVVCPAGRQHNGAVFRIIL